MPNLSKALGLSLASKQSSKQKIANLSRYTWYLCKTSFPDLRHTGCAALDCCEETGLASPSPAFINFLRQGLTVLPWPA